MSHVSSAADGNLYRPIILRRVSVFLGLEARSRSQYFVLPPRQRRGSFFLHYWASKYPTARWPGPQLTLDKMLKLMSMARLARHPRAAVYGSCRSHPAISISSPGPAVPCCSPSTGRPPSVGPSSSAGGGRRRRTGGAAFTADRVDAAPSLTSPGGPLRWIPGVSARRAPSIFLLFIAIVSSSQRRRVPDPPLAPRHGTASSGTACFLAAIGSPSLGSPSSLRSPESRDLSLTAC